MSDNIIKNNKNNSARYSLNDISGSGNTKRRNALDNISKKLTVAEVGDVEEQARKEGYEIGFKEGQRDGLLAGQADVNATVRKFTSLIQSLNKPLEVLDDEVMIFFT